MALETFQYIDDLVATNPTATDNVSQGDDHIRGIKTTLKNTFPNVTGAITLTEAEINNRLGNISEDTTPQLGGNLDTNGNNINFGDNEKAIFGAGNDLEIYHDGSHSYIKDVGTGRLYIGTDGDEIRLNTQGSSEYGIRVIQDGAVNLYHDNSAKLATTSTGVNVTGTLTADGLDMEDNQQIKLGTSDDLLIYHDGSNSYIKDTGTGNLFIDATSLRLRSADGEAYFQGNANGNTVIYYDGSQKLATTSSGVSVTGRATGTQTTDNDGSFDLSASNHFQCTPSANLTLTFTNHTSGQAGTIILKNTGGYTVSAHADTLVMGADLLTTISTAGTYVLGYISDGTDTRIYNSGAQQ